MLYSRNNDVNKNAYLNTYKNIVDTSLEAIMITDSTHKIIYVNQKFYNMLGFSEEEVIGTDRFFWSKEHIEFVKNSKKFEDKDFIYNGSLITKDGREIKVSLRGLPFVDGGRVNIFTDLDEIENLRRINQELVNLNQMKDDFLNIASHELRTPLTSIKGYLSMLLDGDFGELNDSTKQVMTSMLSNTQRLILLINDMLDISKLEAGKMQFIIEEININELLDEIYFEYINIAKEKEIIFNITKTDNFYIKSDRNRLKQIIINLLSNALKFTNPGKEIQIIASKLSDNYLKIEVIDQGIGISQDDIGKIFSKFGQAESSLKRNTNGTGLGLNIASKIIQNLGGELRLDTKIGEGSNFYFTIPFEKAL